MGLRSSATLKGAAVLLRISSTLTPSACSTRVRPSVGLTSKTARSVMIFHTQRGPVRGKVHSDKILGLPFLSVCSCFSSRISELHWRLKGVWAGSAYHSNNNLGLLRVGDQVHGTTDTLDLTGKHEVGQIWRNRISNCDRRRHGYRDTHLRTG